MTDKEKKKAAAKPEDVPFYDAIPALAKGTAKVKFTTPDGKHVVSRTMTIADIARRQDEIAQLQAEQKLELDALKDAGQTLMLQAKMKSVIVLDGGDKLKVTRTVGSNSHIKRDLLLKAGVKQAIIEKATVKTEWSSLKVTRRKPGEDAEGGEGSEE